VTLPNKALHQSRRRDIGVESKRQLGGGLAAERQGTEGAPNGTSPAGRCLYSMTTFMLVLASFLALDATAEPIVPTGSDASSLKATVKVVSPWCRGRPRVRLTLKNISEKTVWLALERSSKRSIEWMHFSYWDEKGGQVSGGNEDGDVLAFLRSDESTRLDPGISKSWLLALAPQKVHQGRVTVGISGPVYGTSNLDHDHIAAYEFQAEITVMLNKADRCYTVGGS